VTAWRNHAAAIDAVSYRIVSHRIVSCILYVRMHVSHQAKCLVCRCWCPSVWLHCYTATLLQHVDSDDTASASYPRRKRSDGLRVSSWFCFLVYLEVTTAVTVRVTVARQSNQVCNAAAQPSVGQRHVSSGMMNKTRQRRWHKTRNKASEKETDRGLFPLTVVSL
jgi:hypothetical protein